MSVFNPALFQQMSFQGANSTEFIPFPAGQHQFCIMKSEVVQWNTADNTKQGLKLVLEVEPIDGDGKIKEATGRDTNKLKWDIMLDLTENGQGLDFGKGKNVRLGRLRERVGLNDPAADFNFSMLVGKMVDLDVGHSVYKGEPIANVNGLAAPAAD